LMTLLSAERHYWHWHYWAPPLTLRHYADITPHYIAFIFLSHCAAITLMDIDISHWHWHYWYWHFSILMMPPLLILMPLLPLRHW
jgi:hypothetical protein